MTRSLQTSFQSTLNENIQNPAKLKLQLFPIDECTQKALETVKLMGNLNTGDNFFNSFNKVLVVRMTKKVLTSINFAGSSQPSSGTYFEYTKENIVRVRTPQSQMGKLKVVESRADSFSLLGA